MYLLIGVYLYDQCDAIDKYMNKFINYYLINALLVLFYLLRP